MGGHVNETRPGVPSPPPPPNDDKPRESNDPQALPPAGISEEAVDKTRAWTGLWVVVAGNAAIATAAIVALLNLTGAGASNSVLPSILTSAFTAIATMTTAYFGIRASSNTAQKSIKYIKQ
jgi:hypothetical protein